MTQQPNSPNKPSPKNPQRDPKNPDQGPGTGREPERGPADKQRVHTNVPEPRDIERDPAGTMEFPGANPEEPAKKLAGNRPVPHLDDETPGNEPELGGDPDQPVVHAPASNRRP